MVPNQGEIGFLRDSGVICSNRFHNPARRYHPIPPWSDLKCKPTY